ncbi:hypothetical protein KIL84_022016 [Mauremys mutica]|uniref:Uncharacterized protein n=1 Tax=Mauremys mutica TaxID=74926 RepID=A0A9D3XGF6_9SAUR|nr:hypothetical protein KIL84_022016 [Mauremys mutica]
MAYLAHPLCTEAASRLPVHPWGAACELVCGAQQPETEGLSLLTHQVSLNPELPGPALGVEADAHDLIPSCWYFYPLPCQRLSPVPAACCKQVTDSPLELSALCAAPWKSVAACTVRGHCPPTGLGPSPRPAQLLGSS